MHRYGRRRQPLTPDQEAAVRKALANGATRDQARGLVRTSWPPERGGVKTPYSLGVMEPGRHGRVLPGPSATGCSIVD